jgi:hypothetical protein
LNQFGVATWPLLSARFRHTTYFLRDDMKLYKSKAPFQTLIPVSFEVSAVIGVELWSHHLSVLHIMFLHVLYGALHGCQRVHLVLD